MQPGARLFLIDPAPFAAELANAQGRLGVEQARLVAATRQWRRIEPLARRGFVSTQSRDDAEANYIAARAAVAAASAEVKRAQLNLGYTDVRAPIGGVTGLEARSEGSMVNTDDDTALLTTITQASRLDVVFSMPEAEARALRTALAANPDSIGVRVHPASSEPVPLLARIDFMSVQVAPSTGTVDVRAVLPNSAGWLAPGQFVRAEIEGLMTDSGIHVPSRAVVHGADGPFLWVLDRQHKARMRTVGLGGVNGNFTRIENGLLAGDRVIVEGTLKLQPEMVVRPLATALAQGESAGKAGAR